MGRLELDASRLVDLGKLGRHGHHWIVASPLSSPQHNDGSQCLHLQPPKYRSLNSRIVCCHLRPEFIQFSFNGCAGLVRYSSQRPNFPAMSMMQCTAPLEGQLLVAYFMLFVN
jgi:hypothetical protein